MEIVLFTVVAGTLYLAADRLLALVERRRGGPLPNRSVIFFLLLLGLALPVFALIRSFLGT
ncbi:MAG: hypothetical protein H6852_00940 [Geminicoccaceae bacterium]|jgi:hypothetical protein|nr:hypothetical protein [Geminicoccaceae bacterium]MCB9966184.1 hypothetical protein [Geminicoccaceae bacterium]HRY26130.1 hypothetical protein [Geminicoccaceae bacterium]